MHNHRLYLYEACSDMRFIDRRNGIDNLYIHTRIHLSAYSLLWTIAIIKIQYYVSRGLFRVNIINLQQKFEKRIILVDWRKNERFWERFVGETLVFSLESESISRQIE